MGMVLFLVFALGFVCASVLLTAALFLKSENSPSVKQIFHSSSVKQPKTKNQKSVIILDDKHEKDIEDE